MEPWNPHNVDPSLMTHEEYLRLANYNNKSHPSSAYQTNVGNISYFHREDFTPFRRVKIRGLEFEIRVRRLKMKYVKKGGDFGITYQDGEAVMMTDEEIAEAQLQPYEYSIGIWTPEEGDNCIASAQDEWGCVLVMVTKEYRGFGLGVLLGKLARTFEPGKPSGGFTYSGRINFDKVYREFVRDAVTSGKYTRMIKLGLLSTARAKEIIASAKLNERSVPKKDNLSSNNPDDWLVFDDTHGSYIIYDRKLPQLLHDDVDERFCEKMIKGYIYVAISNEGYGRVKKLYASDPRLKTFLYALAHHRCQADQATLYVEPDDQDIKGFKFGPETLVAGYKSCPVISGPSIDGEPMGRSEAKFRVVFDRYDEFKHRLYDFAESLAQKIKE